MSKLKTFNAYEDMLDKETQYHSESVCMSTTGDAPEDEKQFKSHNSYIVEKGLADLKKDPMVFHPNYYTIGGIETLDIIKAKKLDFFTGNAIKYICRSKYKDKEIQDLEKAIFYLQIKVSDLKNETI